MLPALLSIVHWLISARWAWLVKPSIQKLLMSLKYGWVNLTNSISLRDSMTAGYHPGPSPEKQMTYYINLVLVLFNNFQHNCRY